MTFTTTPDAKVVGALMAAGETLTALEEFVFRWEPPGEQAAAQFRIDLNTAIQEMRKEFTRIGEQNAKK